jgi:hypothetical protein
VDSPEWIFIRSIRRDTGLKASTGQFAIMGPFPIATGRTYMATEAYCVKCREKREMQDEEEVTMKNGRPAVQGKCPVCGTKLFRIKSTKKAD